MSDGFLKVEKMLSKLLRKLYDKEREDYSELVLGRLSDFRYWMAGCFLLWPIGLFRLFSSRLFAAGFFRIISIVVTQDQFPFSGARLISRLRATCLHARLDFWISRGLARILARRAALSSRRVGFHQSKFLRINISNL